MLCVYESILFILVEVEVWLCVVGFGDCLVEMMCWEFLFKSVWEFFFLFVVEFGLLVVW